jgi:hypothetical protein
VEGRVLAAAGCRRVLRQDAAHGRQKLQTPHSPSGNKSGGMDAAANPARSHGGRGRDSEQPGTEAGASGEHDAKSGAGKAAVSEERAGGGRSAARPGGAYSRSKSGRTLRGNAPPGPPAVLRRVLTGRGRDSGPAAYSPPPPTWTGRGRAVLRPGRAWVRQAACGGEVRNQ